MSWWIYVAFWLAVFENENQDTSVRLLCVLHRIVLCFAKKVFYEIENRVKLLVYGFANLVCVFRFSVSEIQVNILCLKQLKKQNI